MTPCYRHDMATTPRRTVRIPTPLWDKAREVANANQTTVTAVITTALEDYTEDKK